LVVFRGFAKLVTTSADFLPRDVATAVRDKQPATLTLVFIFWAIFAVSIAITVVLNPGLFLRNDPDSLMRLVGVRDFLAGQGWFDLVQHRMDPPAGVLMHWSRLIDAPIAALVLFGNAIGAGESFALIVWPLILFLGFMAGATFAATALGGRAAAPPTLILSLLFVDPLLSYLPYDIDHHNAQYALLAAVLAAALRLRTSPAFGLAAGAGAALMLAIGLEMLPYVGLICALIALQWAFRAEGRRGAALFGIAFAIATPALYVAVSSPEARYACDSLSLAYVFPVAVAGVGLAVLARILEQRGTLFRFVGLAALAAAAAACLALIAPGCFGGPYGFLSPELKDLWLDTVREAQSLPAFAARAPASAIATTGAPIVALVVALRRIRPGSRVADLWFIPTVLLSAALALSFYQVRTIPFANTIAIPILGAWLAEIAARHGIHRWRPIRPALPLIGAFLLAMPIMHFIAGAAAVQAVSLATGGRIAPMRAVEAPATEVSGLSTTEKNCLGPASAALLAEVPTGLVMAPVFYGPAVLALSSHSVVAGPYHRAGAAILDDIAAMKGPLAGAGAIIRARGVDYVAICATSRESALAKQKAPNGLIAQLLADRAPDWLEQVPSDMETKLRLWRVRD
jgi:hypothetical protein